MNSRPDGYHSARVLIVDDERHNRQVLEVMLAPEGFHILTAASGEEALAMVTQHPPDLILLDIMMPGMDGYQVVAKIKANLTTTNIPIIVVTALDDRNAKMLGLNAGAEDFLSKPVDRSELCVRVRNLLRLKAYGDDYDRYSRILEDEVASRTADLAERTQQAAVLREQAALLDLAQDAIVVQDMNSRILFWNHGAEVMYGWLSNEALGRLSLELLRTHFPEPIGSIHAHLLRHGKWEGEAVQYTRDGTRLVVASRWALQRTGDGAPVRILTINNDITDRKQAEEALEQSRQDQLRFKDEFLSHVSHELRSPLTAIKQFTTILLGGVAGELNEEQSKYEQIVLKNIQQLQAMIDDLLEVTRLGTGKLTVEPDQVSVSDAVMDTLQTLQETAHAKGVVLSWHGPPDLPAAYTDWTRLRQILIILLDNAIKFTPDGSAVHVEAQVLPHNRRYLLIEVSDTGCGISPEIAERIFERLYQVPERIQTSRKGLGLGLFICKELVTRQGGTIWVKNRPEKGTTFSFTLPVFSLNTVIAPLFKDGRWPAESVALVMVETFSPDAWPSKESREEWSHEARSLLQRCSLPNLDLVLPMMSSGDGEERLFLAAFATDKGASVLVNRIREQFDLLPHPKQADLTTTVSYSMLEVSPPDVGASMENVVTSMALSLEEGIRSRILSEASYHE